MGELESTKTFNDVVAIARQIRSLQDSYVYESEQFADYIEDYGELSAKTLKDYIEQLKQLKSKQSNSKISAETYNKHIKAIKNRIRWILEHQNVDPILHYQINEFLKKIKLKKVHSRTVSEEDIPTQEEVQILFASAPTRLGLMMEFLLYTGARISEALNVTFGDVRKQKASVVIRLRGKGNKERKVYLIRDVYDRIVKEFGGKEYLFEHHGKQYSRTAVTNRIRDLSLKTIGKAISAHDLRHRIGTDMTKTYGLWAAKEYLGHASVKTTDEFYNHNKVTARDVQDLYR